MMDYIRIHVGHTIDIHKKNISSWTPCELLLQRKCICKCTKCRPWTIPKFEVYEICTSIWDVVSKMTPSTLWWTNIAIENDHLKWIFPLKMVIFHCYVSSPEGNRVSSTWWNSACMICDTLINIPDDRNGIQPMTGIFDKTCHWLSLRLSSGKVIPYHPWVNLQRELLKSPGGHIWIYIAIYTCIYVVLFYVSIS